MGKVDIELSVHENHFSILSICRCQEQEKSNQCKVILTYLVFKKQSFLDKNVSSKTILLPTANQETHWTRHK